MGYELRIERPAPLSFAELANVLGRAGFEFRGSQEEGEVLARYGDAVHAIAVWNGALTGAPGSDWQVAQLARVSGLLGARLVGEDGESYAIRDGVVEQHSGSAAYEFGKLDEILAAARPPGPRSGRIRRMGRPEPEGHPTPYAEVVLDLVERIPPGRVMSYGDIAEYLGEGGPVRSAGSCRSGAEASPGGASCTPTAPRRPAMSSAVSPTGGRRGPRCGEPGRTCASRDGTDSPKERVTGSPGPLTWRGTETQSCPERRCLPHGHRRLTRAYERRSPRRAAAGRTGSLRPGEPLDSVMASVLAEGLTPAERKRFDADVLAGPLGSRLDIAVKRGAARRREFVTAVKPYLASVDPQVKLDLPVARRLAFHLIDRRGVDELAEGDALSKIVTAAAEPSRRVRKSMRWYADLPLRDELPESLYRLRAADLIPVTQVEDVSWSGDRLRITGHAYLAGLSVRSRRFNRATVVLRGPRWLPRCACAPAGSTTRRPPTAPARRAATTTGPDSPPSSPRGRCAGAPRCGRSPAAASGCCAAGAPYGTPPPGARRS
nr:hypothetical protein GCM10020093_059630 [Planobispora longispora]